MKRAARPRTGGRAAQAASGWRTAKAGGGAAAVPPAYGIGLADARAAHLPSPGVPLDAAVRATFEPRFGCDFSAVRVHTGAAAAAQAAAIGARAYTHGRDIVFGDGVYAPESDAGRHLLAHELTHVAQQAAANTRTGGTGRPGDPYEREADAVAGAVSAGGSAPPLAAIPSPVPAIQCDLALTPPVKAAGPLPSLGEAEKKVAIPYNEARFKGVDAAVVTTVEDITGAVRPKRSPAKVDGVFADAIAAWQTWFNLPPDGRMTPLTARTFADELLAEAVSGRVAKPVAERLRGAAKELDERVAAGPLRPAGAAQLPNETAWSPPSDIAGLRQEIVQDFQNGSDAGRATAKWLARAYLLRAGSSLFDDDRLEYLTAIAATLSSHGRMAEAIEVVSLIGVSTEAGRTAMQDALGKVGANAAAGANAARDYLKALLRLAGITAADQPADPQQWLEKHTASVGKAIAALVPPLGSEIGRQLTGSVLKSSFVKDVPSNPVPKGAGSIAHLKKDPKAGNRMRADCDVYATYGLRLLRAEGWQPVGYFTFQGAKADDIAHAVGIARRPVGNKTEYIVVDSMNSDFLISLGTLTDDAAAIRETDARCSRSWAFRYYAPVMGEGAINPGLNEFHPDRFKYPP